MHCSPYYWKIALRLKPHNARVFLASAHLRSPLCLLSCESPCSSSDKRAISVFELPFSRRFSGNGKTDSAAVRRRSAAKSHTLRAVSKIRAAHKKIRPRHLLSRTDEITLRGATLIRGNPRSLRNTIIFPATDVCLTSQNTQQAFQDLKLDVWSSFPIRVSRLTAFDCALSGPFNKLRSAGFSSPPALCKCTICFYLHLIGLWTLFDLFLIVPLQRSSVKVIFSLFLFELYKFFLFSWKFSQIIKKWGEFPCYP